MSTLATTTPGVYFEQIDRARAAIGPLRTDITGFLGYARQGPLLVPVKVTSWRQFTAVFGEPFPFAFQAAYLAYAVRGFFDNGGAACYVVRVADPAAAVAATLLLPDTTGAPLLSLWASHGTLHDPVTGGVRVENGRPLQYDSPGAWANSLSVSVQPAGLGHTQTGRPQPEDGRASYVNSLSGFEIGSIVHFSQGDSEAGQYRRVDDINPHLRQLVWNEPIDSFGFDLTLPIQLETVEFTLLLHRDGQIIERHRHLSLSPTHSRSVATRLPAESALLDVAVLPDLEAGTWANPAQWPAAVDRLPLSGGHDGLATVTKEDFLAGLDQLALVDEVSLLVAPDLVLRAEAPPTRRRAQRPHDPCQILTAPLSRQLFGAVLERRTVDDTLQTRLDELAGVCGPLDATAEQGLPLAGVTVRVLEIDNPPVISDACGRFTLSNLPPGRVTLLFEREGYHDLERTMQSYAVLPDEPVRSYLAPVTLPPAFSLDDIFDVQTAMLRQGEAGLYRVALLDPPPEMLGLDEIQTWRARFDSAFAALNYPWLTVSDLENDGVRDVPPGGHVAGLIARTDLTQGVHRAPANLRLDGVKALTRSLNDVEQGLLNPQGINCLRVLPGRGIRLYGARTLSSDGEWRYLNVRRLVLMLEEAIEDASQWAVFEPNNTVLRQALTFSLNSFLNTMWRQGALAGAAPEAAYQVKCDEENNPPSVIDAGQIIADIGVAPAIPFEFIHFKLGRTVEAIEVTE
jgi:uncharacterized protein